MKNILSLFVLLFSALSIASCSNKKSDAATPTTDSTAATAKADTPYADTEQNNTFDATLAGHQFHITIHRAADPSLPIVTDELGKTFYDNRVSVNITRDGEAFFSHDYTKEAFVDFLSPDERQGTVLLGMAYDSFKSDGHAIRLGAQIGQVGIEEGPAFSVEIPLDGSASGIVRDKNQDTTGEEGMTD